MVMVAPVYSSGEQVSPVFERFQESRVRELLRVKKDFPKPGVNFLDFNQVFTDASLTKDIAKLFLLQANISYADVILAPEARGFILGPVMASLADCAFVPLRKHGKLPDFGNLKTESYGTEYSTDALDLDLDLVSKFKGKKVVIYDDVLATGGTAGAAVKLAELFEPSSISLCFLAEIESLDARHSEGLKNYPLYSLIKI